jgi:hypothetical protein
VHQYTFIALDLARERDREAQLRSLAAIAHEASAGRPSWPRRTLAHGFALVSRGSASVTRRLDECVADDLGRSLAPTD